MGKKLRAWTRQRRASSLGSLQCGQCGNTVGKILDRAAYQIHGLGQGEQEVLGVRSSPMSRRRPLQVGEHALADGTTEHQYEAVPITKDENGLEVAGLKQRLVSLCIVWTSVTPSDRTRTQCLVQGRSDLLWQAPLRNQVTSPNAVNLRRFGAPMAMQPPFLGRSDQHGPAVDRLVGGRPERQSAFNRIAREIQRARLDVDNCKRPRQPSARGRLGKPARFLHRFSSL